MSSNESLKQFRAASFPQPNQNLTRKGQVSISLANDAEASKIS